MSNNECIHAWTPILAAAIISRDVRVGQGGTRRAYCTSFRTLSPPPACAVPDSSKMHVPLWQAIAANDARGTERALRRGAEVDYRGAGGLTPLLAAAERGALPTAALLLQHRASVDMADDRGRTPLMLAARSPNDELVAALLEAHATPSPSLSVSLSLTPTLTPDPNP